MEFKTFFKKQPKYDVNDVELEKQEFRSLKIVKTSAEKRSKDFSLTNSEFKHLTSGVCFYCGAEPREYSEGSVRNGIDRFYNEEGYLYNNVISSCSTCNKMKGTLSPDEFLNHVDKITTSSNELNTLIRTYGETSFEVKAYSFRRGRYPSPNEILEMLRLNLLSKEDVKDYDFKSALKRYPNEFEIVKKQLKSMGILPKKFTREAYEKDQINEWEIHTKF